MPGQKPGHTIRGFAKRVGQGAGRPRGRTHPVPADWRNSVMRTLDMVQNLGSKRQLANGSAGGAETAHNIETQQLLAPWTTCMWESCEYNILSGYAVYTPWSLRRKSCGTYSHAIAPCPILKLFLSCVSKSSPFNISKKVYYMFLYVILGFHNKQRCHFKIHSGHIHGWLMRVSVNHHVYI